MSRSGVRKDRKARSVELSTRAWVMVLKKMSAWMKPHGVSGADSGVAEGLGQEALADAGGSHQQHVLVPVEKLQGEHGVQQAAVPG